MTVNKVYHVTTIPQVAKDVGEDEDRLRDIARNGDRVHLGLCIEEDGVQANFGIENLIELIKLYKENRRCSGANHSTMQLTPNGYG
ncbi:hypothetical protein PMN64_39340 [Bradyrhizobium sp. UFLA01-814]|uniref:hypothetical protein n=1 Tax=Bradyrhizobium sp. UFLA01-814 TaxID=3023480 RepID=UPI00398B5EB1